MPQLNILPVNVSQNIDVKDESTTLNSTIENDGFSKYIDLHLTKNKMQDKNNKIDGAKPESDITVQKSSASDENLSEAKIDDLSEVDKINDKTSSASHEHKVAASGNKEQVIANEIDQKSITESEELMSFLTKADKTLLTDSADVSSITYQEQQLSAEQKIKYEAKLLLDPNNVDTDLSKVAKALRNAQIDASIDNTSKDPVTVKEVVLTSAVNALAAETSGDEKMNTQTQEQAPKILAESIKAKPVLSELDNEVIAETKSTKINPILSELENKAITQIKSTDIENKEIKTNVDKGNVVLSEATTEMKVDTKSRSVEVPLTATVKNDVITTKTQKSLNQNLTAEATIDGELALNADEQANLKIKDKVAQDKITEQSQINTEKLAQSTLLKGANKTEEGARLQQSINTDTLSDKQSIESNKVNAQSTSNNQMTSDSVKPQEKSIDEVRGQSDSLKQTQSDKVFAQSEAQLMKKDVLRDSETLITTEKSKQAAPQLNKATLEVTDEITQTETTKVQIKQSDKIQLSSVLDELSQQKVAAENKDATAVGSRTTDGVRNDLLTNPSVIDINGRASQVSQDIIEQQATEVLNPSITTEVSHSQKSNAQLHQETISLFRKDFSEAVKDKVMLMISQKLQQFDITLDPPELGNMQVRVNLQGEQASVNFLVQSQQTKDALEQNMHKLRELLGEQGVDVGDANVEQHSQQSTSKDDSTGKNNNKMNNNIDKLDETDDVITQTLSAQMIDSSTTSVDYYA